MLEQIETALGYHLDNIVKSSKICIFSDYQLSVAGDIISAYADDHSSIQIQNVSSGIIPRWVDSDTSVIIVTDSDNGCVDKVYDVVKKRGCQVYCISGNEKLNKNCEKDGTMLVEIPRTSSINSTIGFTLGILSVMVERMGICDMNKALVERLPTIRNYSNSIESDEGIKDLIKELRDSITAVYGSPDLRASFKDWKILMNNDSRLAFCGELPEYNHNEIVGWANHFQDDRNLKIVVLRGKYKNEVLSTIIDKMIEVLEENGRHVISVRIPGSDPLEKNLYAMILGDYLMKEIGKANI